MSPASGFEPGAAIFLAVIAAQSLRVGVCSRGGLVDGINRNPPGWSRVFCVVSVAGFVDGSRREGIAGWEKGKGVVKLEDSGPVFDEIDLDARGPLLVEARKKPGIQPRKKTRSKP
jgi:hypothetical protein